MTTEPASDGPCVMLPWDTRFWGFPVARLSASTLTTSIAGQAIDWCARHGVRCLYYLAPGSCGDSLARAHEHGFRFVDIRVELCLSLAQTPSATAASHAARVRPAAPEDLPALRRLAAMSHYDTRFFKDGGFDAERAGDLYREWISRDCTQHTVFVCVPPAPASAPCGYISCERDDLRREGRIGLVAVAPEHKGAGFGSALMAAAVRAFQDAQLTTARVTTQGTNVAALRLYERSGFLTSSVGVWFHKWFNPPGPANAV